MKAKGKRRNQQRTEEKDNQESAVKVSAFGNTKLQKERKMMRYAAGQKREDLLCS